MRWSLSRCLRQAGIPAATMFVGKTIIDVVRDDAVAADAIVGNFGIFAILWLAVAALCWLGSRMTGG